MEKLGNFWPAVQGITGIYCAVLGTVTTLFPAVPGQPRWQWAIRMTAPPGIAIGLAMLGLVVAVPALMNFFGRRKTSSLAKKDVRSGFTITRADWGNEHKNESITDALRAMTPNAVAFYLCPDSVRPYTTNEKADSVPGPKFLDLEAAFPGKPPVTFRRNEGEIVVLPPDPRAFQEITDLRRDLTRITEVNLDLGNTNRQLQDSVTSLQEKVLERDRAYCAEVDRAKEMYNAYREQVQKTDAVNIRIKELENENASFIQRFGPEVVLSFNGSFFAVENRSKDKDALKLSIDRFETKRYRAEPGTLSQLRFESGPQLIHGAMFDKAKDIRFVDIDLVEMLKDTTAEDFRSTLRFTLRYSDSWGNHFKRDASVEISSILLRTAGTLDIVNHEIQRDAASEAH